MRKWGSCKEEKDPSEFGKNSAGKDGLANSCRDCANRYQRENYMYKLGYREKKSVWSKEWIDKNKDTLEYRKRVRGYSIKIYGLTIADFDAMCVAQAECCLCCGKYVGWEKLVVDHDHKTGRVRGLLCSHCNSGLGLFDESKYKLEQAVLYLELFCKE